MNRRRFLRGLVACVTPMPFGGILKRMTEAELQALDDPTEPNLPQRLPGHRGVMPVVSVPEQRERRAAMTAMMAQGVSRDAIYTTFAAKFDMTEAAIRELMAEVRAMWDDEDAEAARYAKGAARRRIHRHIQEAAKAGKWTAVANLEKVLSEVEGTNVQEEDLPIDLDGRLSEAIMAVLNSTDPKEVRIMIERERALIELKPPDPVQAAQRLAPGRKVIDAPVDGGG